MTTETATPPPEPTTEEVEIAGLSPQTLACMLMGVILFGVVVSGAYIMTRRTVHAESAPVAAVVQTPVAPAPVPQPAAPVLAQSEPEPQTPAITADETRGKTFLQVGAIERTAAPSYIQGLAAKGFAPRIADGPEPAIVRILIGPLSGPALSETSAKLTAAGVASFPKSYAP